MNSYKNETCEGCIHHEDTTCGYFANWIDSPNIGDVPLRPTVVDDDPACAHFQPDLQCRQVRALERLSSCVSTGTKWNHIETYDNGRNDT